MRVGEFTPRVLLLFGVYVLLLAGYALWCWHDSNERIAQIERDFAPIVPSIR